MSPDALFLRKGNLVVYPGDPQGTTFTAPGRARFVGDLPLDSIDRKGIDLSEMKFSFEIQNADSMSPNNALIQVYNLSQDTVKRLKAYEYARVVLQAGYESNHGVIFSGDVVQYESGRESPTETFLRIFASDGDIGFNEGIVNRVFPRGSNALDHIKEGARAMGMDISRVPDLAGSSPRLARGKVGYGMARDLVRNATDTINSSWSIQDGKVVVIERAGYLPGEAVVINQSTGMIGVPVQTDQGINVRTLINPKVTIGGLVRLNNTSITQRVQADKREYGVPFNQWAGITFASKIADGADGLYRAYVVEYTGDTRGGPWYSDITCLAVAAATKRVEAP